MRCASSSVLWSCSSACRSLSSLVVSVVFIAFLCENRPSGGESLDFHPPGALQPSGCPLHGKALVADGDIAPCVWLDLDARLPDQGADFLAIRTAAHEIADLLPLAVDFA